MSGPRDYSLDEVKRGLAEDSILLVDVREPHEFAAGHIPGAVNLPLSSFDPASIAAKPGQEVVFSCRSGVRTLKAISASLEAGLDARMGAGGRGNRDGLRKGGRAARARAEPLSGSMRG